MDANESFRAQRMRNLPPAATSLCEGVWFYSWMERRNSRLTDASKLLMGILEGICGSVWYVCKYFRSCQAHNQLKSSTTIFFYRAYVVNYSTVKYILILYLQFSTTMDIEMPQAQASSTPPQQPINVHSSIISSLRPT